MSEPKPDPKYDFSAESDYLCHISECIVYLLKYMAEHPVRYPAAIRAYMTIQYGLIPIINVNCKHDSECQVNAGAPCGGLTDAVNDLDTAFECIDMEMDFEASPDEVLPDFEI